MCVGGMSCNDVLGVKHPIFTRWYTDPWSCWACPQPRICCFSDWKESWNSYEGWFQTSQYVLLVASEIRRWHRNLFHLDVWENRSPRGRGESARLACAAWEFRDPMPLTCHLTPSHPRWSQPRSLQLLPVPNRMFPSFWREAFRLSSCPSYHLAMSYLGTPQCRHI